MRAGERGYSAVELIVAGGLFFIVLMGVMALFIAQSRLGWISRGQYDVQSSAHRTLDNLVEGERRTWAGAEIRGLRYASAMAVSPDGICFRTYDHIVTYYLEGATLYRRVEPAVPGPLAVNPGGGSPVLEHVVGFSALPEQYTVTLADGSETQALAVALHLAVRKDPEQDIVLNTSVRLRNWSPDP